MNYANIYDALISRAKTRVLDSYTEKHHIVPRCMGGEDSPENLAELTPEEHYLAHQLLVKIHPGNYALVKAAAMMIPDRPSNKLYGWLRRKLAEAQSIAQSGELNSQYNTKWVTNGEVDKKVPKDHKLEEGWSEGRKSRVIRKKEKKKTDEIKAAQKRERKEKKIEELRSLHEVYLIGGFEAVKSLGYTKSKQNLVMRFAQYLPEFVPQNGKKRGLR
jgi:hypothetical protein